MCATRILPVVLALSLLSGTLWAADVILNEYNAVGGTDFLGGGDSSADESGGRASDSYFGRIAGNGGDWFEMVVIKDHLDMRGWLLDTFNNGKLDKTLTLTSDPIWQDLRAGTIITVVEDMPSDVSYDPAAGDWWINVQASKDTDGRYITASTFTVNATNWQLRIRNVGGTIVFGPAGEGVSPDVNISSTEIFRLEAKPTASITPTSKDYDDGSDLSTFGAPNRWGIQDFNEVRPVLPKPAATIKVLAPNGGETLGPGDIITVKWQSQGVPEEVLVEFSLDGGLSWSPVYPPNAGNTGQYKWLVPLVDSDQAQIRVSSTNRPAVFDISDKPFAIVQSLSMADLNGDDVVNFFDFAIMASAWAQ